MDVFGAVGEREVGARQGEEGVDGLEVDAVEEGDVGYLGRWGHCCHVGRRS